MELATIHRPRGALTSSTSSFTTGTSAVAVTTGPLVLAAMTQIHKISR